ncbi:hydroxypyruvate isomerase family protein [Actinopolymorpha alba]|uniref:hydroxypyruvate isomerase family protein n=1 Tax=Actinopolymorpha alba TaxID=533267 RepID=UPI00036DE1FD|nr:TIM barrel protein [Actinopolymorpha alba]
MRFSANISLLFPELPLMERPAAARRAGFSYVEAWWPFDGPDPSTGDITAFVDALRAADVELTALNFYAGDMAAGDRGVLCWPDHQEKFRRSVDALRTCALQTGCRAFNALYGRLRDSGPERQSEVAVENLAFAARALADIGGVVLLEPLTAAENPGYPLTTPEEALAVIDRVRAKHGLTNLALLFDTYHLAGNGVELFAALEAALPRIGHVQVADHPGRGQPGTGRLDIPGILRVLAEGGYAGYVGCEYKPQGRTEDSFEWLKACS